VTWPAALPNGWQIQQMRGRDSRSYHVRRHFLCRRERWDEVTTLSRREISRLAGIITAAGCPCGVNAQPRDTPWSLAHGWALEAYVSDYMPAARLAFDEVVVTGQGLFWTESAPGGGGREVYVLDPSWVVVIASGKRDLVWRTAFRLYGRGRRGATPERIYRHHVRSQRKLASVIHGHAENSGEGNS